MLRIAGTLDFGMVGVIAEISRILAAAAIPIFVISTYDTDYILVKDTQRDNAYLALRQNGHTVGP